MCGNNHVISSLIIYLHTLNHGSPGNNCYIPTTPSSDLECTAYFTHSYLGATGRVIRHRDNTFFRQQPGASSPYGYQGYAMVAGNFRSTGREDYAVSVPRANTYRGKVHPCDT